MDGRIEIVLCAWKPSDIIELRDCAHGEKLVILADGRGGTG